MATQSTRATIALLCAAAIAALALFSAPEAGAAASHKKSIWGPTFQNGVSQFPIYQELGVGLYQIAIGWGDTASTRPADPTNPDDPAYQWPVDVDRAVSEAAKYGIDVSILLTQSPQWASGGSDNYFAPRNPQDFADFAIAAARRYPNVRLWMIWGEPTVAVHFKPFSRKRTPGRYAQLLDLSYGALKAVNPANLVIGGNTITRGQIRPQDFIERLRLPNGKPPRMDMWGHNPFSTRKPDLKADPKKPGTADTSDLDSLLHWIDQDLRQGKRNRRLQLFLSEWTILTEHSSPLFNFWADRSTVARHLSRALRITRRMRRVYTLGWYSLYDESPMGHDSNNWGLLTYDGQPKPAYFAFKQG